MTDAVAYERLEAEAGIINANFSNKRLFNISVNSYGQFMTALFWRNQTVFNMNGVISPKFLYGIGIYTGVEGAADFEEGVIIAKAVAFIRMRMEIPRI
jgi:hypothetical protein